MNDVLATAGKAAGLGGIALGVLLLIFREIIRRDIFPMLAKQQAFHLLRLMVIAVSIVTALGIIAWTIGTISQSHGPLVNNMGNTNVTAIQSVTNVSPSIANITGSSVTNVEGPSVNNSTGPCNFAVHNHNLLTALINFGSISCTDNAAKLRITYLMLDARSYAHLRAGILTKEMVAVFGEAPRILHTGIDDTVNAIARKYRGYSEGLADYDAPSLETIVDADGAVDQGAEGPIDLGADGPPRKFYNLKGYNKGYVGLPQFLPLVFPDIKSLDAIYKTSSWPDGYRQFFREYYDLLKKDPDDPPVSLDAAAIGSVVLWRPFLPEDLSRIPDLFEAARVRADALSDAKKKSGTSSIDSPDLFESADELADERKSTVQGQIPFLSDVTKEGWPAGFLTIYGYPEMHEDDLIGWTFVVPMPDMYVMVAMVENIGAPGATLNVDSIQVAVDVRTGLRPSDFSVDHMPVHDAAWVASPIAAGEKVVIPLRLELRPSQEVGREDAPDVFDPDSATAAFMSKAFKTRAPSSSVAWAGIHKQISAFRPPALPPPAKSFTFGPALIPVSVSMDGQRVALRQFNPADMIMIGTFEGGSCPVLYAKLEGTGALVRLRPMITKASSSARAQIDRITVEGASALVLREEELEISHVQKLELTGGVGGRLHKSLPGFLLKPGEEIDVSLPAGYRGHPLTLSLTGYYDRIAVHSSDAAIRRQPVGGG